MAGGLSRVRCNQMLYCIRLDILSQRRIENRSNVLAFTAFLRQDESLKAKWMDPIRGHS